MKSSVVSGSSFFNHATLAGGIEYGGEHLRIAIVPTGIEISLGSSMKPGVIPKG